MNTSFTEEQEMLRKTARDFLATECPKTKVRELEESDKGYDSGMWKKMADLGWMGLVIPEEYDGMGMTFQDLTIVLEEMGRNILPGPFFCTVVEGALPILDAGSERQKREFLPKIAKGDVIWTMALLEESGLYNPSGVAARAVPRADSFVIHGTKLFVEMAQVADYLICAARTREGASPAEGITLFMLDAKAPGIHCGIMPTMGMDKLCEVQLDDVTVPGMNILGELDNGWPVIQRILERAAIAKCAESIGGIQACVDITAAYCKERVQYGRPIGAFQALQHMLADMWIAMQTSKYLVYEVAWMESENLPCAKEVAIAKAYVNDNYKEVSRKAVRLHGGIGTSRDHDIPLYYRRAKVADIAFGGSDFQREAVATKIGLIS